jgi:hypothetical protein
MREQLSRLREIMGDEFVCNELTSYLSEREANEFVEHVARHWDISELQDDEEESEEEEE